MGGTTHSLLRLFKMRLDAESFEAFLSCKEKRQPPVTHRDEGEDRGLLGLLHNEIISMSTIQGTNRCPTPASTLFQWNTLQISECGGTSWATHVGDQVQPGFTVPPTTVGVWGVHLLAHHSSFSNNRKPKRGLENSMLVFT